MGQDAIGQDGYVNVTVSGGNAGQCDYLNQTSETCLGHRAEGSYACDHASVEERQAAQDAGMGTARYQAYLELSALDPSVTADLCHGLTLAELRWMVNALQSGEASTAQEALEQARAAGVGTGHHAERAGASRRRRGREQAARAQVLAAARATAAATVPAMAAARNSRRRISVLGTVAHTAVFGRIDCGPTAPKPATKRGKGKVDLPLAVFDVTYLGQACVCAKAQYE